MKPLFITFEGLDGSGKSTHLRRAAAWLEKRRVPHLITQEPGGTELGEAIRSVFLDRRWGSLDGIVEALMVFASRRQHLLEVITPALESGRHVICDRFTDSTLAYQGYGRGVSIAALHDLDALATGGRRPDLTLLFDLPSSDARGRGVSAARDSTPGGVDRLDVERLEFYERVRQGYLELVRCEPERFRVVSTLEDVEQTAERVRRVLAETLG